MNRSRSSSGGNSSDNKSSMARINELEKEVVLLRQENEKLKAAAAAAAAAAVEGTQNTNNHTGGSDSNRVSNNNIPNDDKTSKVTELSPEHIERYSRQLLLRQGFGVQGQIQLLNSSVLVVGAGGIGSTVLLYLAGAGIGTLSILDFDVVERSNLHRQIIHRDDHVGVDVDVDVDVDTGTGRGTATTTTMNTNKAVSAARAVRALNPSIDCRPLPIMLTKDNAYDLVQQHDCIVDASDNPRTRYLINDACVLAGKPLISGSAIGTEGQLSVFNWEPGKGSCYRCLYPNPNITAGSKSCSDNGVLGPVPGLIGVLQSLEVLKVLTNTGNPMNDRLLVYDALQCSFLTLKKPTNKKHISDCPVCGKSPTILSMEDSDRDLQSVRGPASYCEANALPTSLEDAYQVTPAEYYKLLQQRPQRQENHTSNHHDHILLDVRVKEQYELCSLDHAINVPLESLPDNLDRLEELTGGWTKPIYCLCRRGIASVEATKLLVDHIMSTTITTPINTDSDTTTGKIKNIQGGLDAWRKQVDASFPRY